MRKLLVLTALLTLTVLTVGCENCRWFRRGALFAPAPDVTCVEPCTPCVPVAPCPSPCAPACGAAPVIGAPAGTYAPAPGP